MKTFGKEFVTSRDAEIGRAETIRMFRRALERLKSGRDVSYLAGLKEDITGMTGITFSMHGFGLSERLAICGSILRRTIGDIHESLGEIKSDEQKRVWVEAIRCAASAEAEIAKIIGRVEQRFDA